MAEKMVRCSRCYEVFDAEEGPCPKCGTPYRPPAAPPPVFDGLYSQRFASAEPTPVIHVPTAPPPRKNSTVLIAAGGAVVVVVLALGGLFALGAFNGPAPTAPPVVVAITPRPSPTPTLPPTISLTLAQLNDPNLSAALTVTAHVQVNSSMAGQPYSTVVFNGQVSNGNESGTIQVGGETREIRLVNDQMYYRVLPSEKWTILSPIPGYWVISPVFGLNSERDIQLVGQEMKDGQELNHLRSTNSWRPDISRLAMEDLTSLPYPAEHATLDLWATSDGAPVEATFSGTNFATDGSKLLDVEVSYSFSQVGVPQTITVPGPSGSPGASGS
jgi:hypothetical protein